MSQEIKIMWVKLAAYYQQQIPDHVLVMYVEDVSDLPSEKVLSAMNQFRRNPKNRRTPIPAQIREMAAPSIVDDDSASREAAARILEAVKKFGYTWPEEAKAFIGEHGWSVIQVYGGWVNFCEGLGVDFSMDTFHAQARELIKARIKYGVGIGDHVSQLEYSKKQSSNISGLIAAKEMP